MNIALGVTEIYVDERKKVKVVQGQVMKFDKTNTIDIPLISNKELKKNGDER